MLKPGQRFTKNGIAVDVHKVEGGEVYYRRWPKGVDEMPWCAGLARLPINEFLAEVEGLEPEAA